MSDTGTRPRYRGMAVTYGGKLATAYWEDRGTLTVALLEDPGTGSMHYTRVAVSMVELEPWNSAEDLTFAADVLEREARYLTPGGPGQVRLEALAAVYRRHARTCVADSGSMTGCRPVCDAPATRLVTSDGYGGPYTRRLCDRHAHHEPARVYPDRVTDNRPISED